MAKLTLPDEINRFMDRLKKAHPGTKGLAISFVYKGGCMTVVRGDLSRSKATIRRHISEHENEPWDKESA